MGMEPGISFRRSLRGSGVRVRSSRAVMGLGRELKEVPGYAKDARQRLD